jgi:hypothetical protein
MEALQKKCDITFQFMVGGLVIHFAGIFHLSFSVRKLFKNFMFLQWGKVFAILGGKYDP